MEALLPVLIFIFIIPPFNYGLELDSSILDLAQDDPKLIEAIKQHYLIRPPLENEARNLSRRLDLNGQEGQPLIIDKEILKGKIEKGFFIEAGAYDGEAFSNTLYFELKQKWTGLLVEANPDAFEELKWKKRKAWLNANCLSTQNRPEMVQFDAAGLLGGIIHNGIKPGTDEQKDGKIKVGGGMHLVIPEATDLHPFKRKTVEKLCLPLYSLLLALGNPTVHYFR